MVRYDRIRGGLDHADLVQEERIEAHRVLVVELAPPVVRQRSNPSPAGAFGSRPAMAMPIPHAAGDGINLALVRSLEPPGGRK